MKWMKERDLLIAQTMAFVQSVTGKTPDAARTVTASAALLSVETFEPVAPAASPLPDFTPSWEQAPPAPAAPIIAQAPVIEEATVEVPVETPRQLLGPAPLARLDLREDFQSEIRARVANFRAHQERFNREREAYCTATMAKVHATLKESELPPLRPGK
jgi:hypothetical protein